MAQIQGARERKDVWGQYICELDQTDARVGLHLAVFVEPYLRLILRGRKTIESRFSVKSLAPYRKVEIGDVLLLKRAGGPVTGACRVADVWFYGLEANSWSAIRKDFADAMCVSDTEFWRKRESARYGTLMRIDEVRTMPSLFLNKRDRRGWVILKSSSGSDSCLWRE